MNPGVEQFLNELEEFAPGLSNGDGKTLGELLAEQSDAVLAASLRSAMCGNEIVEELLVVRHHTKLIRVLRALGADEHTAENLVQDLCANVLQGALDNFDAREASSRRSSSSTHVIPKPPADSRTCSSCLIPCAWETAGTTTGWEYLPKLIPNAASDRRARQERGHEEL
jgi:hypothetical protein